MRTWACLAKTVSLFDGNLESFVYCLNELLGHWSGPAVEHTKAAEIILVDYRMLSKQQDYRWNHVRKRYLMGLNKGTELLYLKLWHHDQREAAIETLAY